MSRGSDGARAYTRAWRACPAWPAHQLQPAATCCNPILALRPAVPCSQPGPPIPGRPAACCQSHACVHALSVCTTGWHGPQPAACVLPWLLCCSTAAPGHTWPHTSHARRPCLSQPVCGQVLSAVCAAQPACGAHAWAGEALHHWPHLLSPVPGPRPGAAQPSQLTGRMPWLPLVLRAGVASSLLQHTPVRHQRAHSLRCTPQQPAAAACPALATAHEHARHTLHAPPLPLACSITTHMPARPAHCQVGWCTAGHVVEQPRCAVTLPVCAPS